jgi:capsular polysaccharide export protein
MDSGPKILFIALYRHQIRYFQQLIRENNHTWIGVLKTNFDLLWPFFLFGKNPSLAEIEMITRYSFSRGCLRYGLTKTNPLYWFYQRYQNFMARWYFSSCHRVLENKNIDGLAVWNGQNLPLAAAVSAARRLGIRTLFFENGPLPNSTMLDPKGINFENSVPRDQEFFIDVHVEEDKLHQLLQTPLVVRAPRKNKPENKTPAVLPDNYLFLPFQTYNDTQVLLFSPWIRGMRELVREVKLALAHLPHPRPVLVVKEHPSCRMNYTDLYEAMAGSEVVFASGISTMELILRSKGVITINSSVGIESILLGKSVLTLGQAFYNIPGLVLHAENTQELIEAVGKLVEFEPLTRLREGFLYYLKYHYLLEGTHRAPNPVYLRSVGERIYNLLANKGLNKR